MRFSEIASRLTGFSTPIFGVSWEPGDADVAVARRVIGFLEDRRVLFAPWNVEIPEHCIESVIEIRRFLTDEIVVAGADDDIVGDLRAMRAACRRFVTEMAELEDRAGRLLPWAVGTPSWMFNDALGQLRAVIGQHVAIIATKFGIDIEDELATILPAADTDDDDDDDGPRRRWRR